MAKLIIVVGIGGSGKTHFCREHAERNNAHAFFDATLTNGNDRRRAGFECLGEMVARLLGRKETCVMDESHLTNPDFRNEFQKFCNEYLKYVEQKWIFFEHNIVACINNVYHDYHKKNRKGLERLEAVKNQNKVYKVPPLEEYPGHTKVQSVYRQPEAQFAEGRTEEALAWLNDEIAKLKAEKSARSK